MNTTSYRIFNPKISSGASRYQILQTAGQNEQNSMKKSYMSENQIMQPIGFMYWSVNYSSVSPHIHRILALFRILLYPTDVTSSHSHLVSLTYTAASNDFRSKGDVPLLVSEFVTHQIIDGELDSLLWGHTNQLGYQASVQTNKTLMSDNLMRKTVSQGYSAVKEEIIIHVGRTLHYNTLQHKEGKTVWQRLHYCGGRNDHTWW